MSAPRTTDADTAPPPDPAAVFVHLDIDCFFAQAEQLRRPELEDLPVAVGGDGTRGVVATANYVARRYGIRSAMPMSTARRLCADLVVVPTDIAWYRELSLEVIAACAQWRGALQRVGLDELYLHLDPGHVDGGFDGERLAEQMRAAVRQRCGLAASVGVAPTPAVAKLASEAAKPDGARWVQPHDVWGFLARHRLSDIGGVGPVTARRLGVAGLIDVTDARAAGAEQLAALLGDNSGAALWDRITAGGAAELPRRREAASVGVERTLASNVTTCDELDRIVAELADEAHRRLTRAGVGATTVTVKMRSARFENHSRAHRLGPAGQYRVERVAATLAAELFERCGRRTRLVGVTYSGLTEQVQLTLFGAGAPRDPASHPGEVVTHQLFGDGEVVTADDHAAVVRFGDQVRIITDPSAHLTRRTGA